MVKVAGLAGTATGGAAGYPVGGREPFGVGPPAGGASFPAGLPGRCCPGVELPDGAPDPDPFAGPVGELETGTIDTPVEVVVEGGEVVVEGGVVEVEGGLVPTEGTKGFGPVDVEGEGVCPELPPGFCGGVVSPGGLGPTVTPGLS